MSLLGRGLASLIPRREVDDAENILEKIDSMEPVSREPENVRVIREQRSGLSRSMSSGKRLSVVEESDDSVVVAEETVEEEVIVPSRPLVTPITPDAEPDELDQQVLNEDEEKVELSNEDKDVAEDEDVGVITSQDDDLFDFQDDEEEAVVELPEKKKDIEPEEKIEEVVEEDSGVIEKEEAVAGDEVSDESEEDEESQIRSALERAAADGRILGERVEHVPLGDIEANPLQPRRMFDAEELDDLVQSLDQHGMLQPLVVMLHPSGQGYQLIAGERRLRAARELKWDSVPCIVRRDVTGDRNRLELALIENVQRSNLNPVEEALGYQRLNEEYGMTHEEIGRRVGRSRVGITNMIRLLQLPAEIQRGLIDNKISIGHARAILMIPDEEKQLRFYKHVLDEGLTVRKAENRARGVQRAMKLNDPLRKKMRGRPALAIKYDGALQDRFGYNARVKFENTKNRFEVVFFAYSEGEAEDLISKLLEDEEAAASPDQDVIED